MSGHPTLIRRLVERAYAPRQQATSPRDTLAALDRLRTLIAAGMPHGDALRFGAAAGGRPAGHLSHASRLVERGAPLSDALRRAGIGLADADLALLRAGEASGTLAGTIGLLCERLAQRGDAKSRVFRALAYPCALLLVTVFVVLAMTTMVLPSFVTLYATSGAPIPTTTRAMLAFGAVVRAYGLHALASLAFIAAATRVLRTAHSRFRAATDHALLAAPFIGTLVRARERSDFYATVACLLRAGVDLETAVESAVATIGNASLRSHAAATVRGLRRGIALSAAVVRSGLDRAQRDAAMLRLGEATGDYAGTCERIAKLELEDYGCALDRISRVVEPAVLLVMAAAVSTAALAIYQPILGSAALMMGGSK
jgi:type II secretory pathway component PulF